MKNLLVVLTVLIMSLPSFSQPTYYKYLQNTFDSTTAANYDTVYVQKLDKQYQSVNLTVENVGAAACTLAVRVGTFLRNAASWTTEEWQYPVSDTVWYQVPLIGKAGTNVTSLIVANTGDAAETILVDKLFIEAIKIYITQNANGKVKVLIEPTKPIK